jgi:hypothetical protein
LNCASLIPSQNVHLTIGRLTRRHACALRRFIAGHKGLSDWLFCSLISGFGLPLSFLLWHLSLYKAAINDGACKCAPAPARMSLQLPGCLYAHASEQELHGSNCQHTHAHVAVLTLAPSANKHGLRRRSVRQFSLHMAG